jgi:hypothetical protein
MSTRRRDTSMPAHIKALMAKGDIRPGDGSRFPPAPVNLTPGDKTAADHVVEGRR